MGNVEPTPLPWIRLRNQFSLYIADRSTSVLVKGTALYFTLKRAFIFLNNAIVMPFGQSQA